MNLELIKNNIIIRLITKKEFDRLTKQLEATKDEFPYRKWNDLYLIYRSILPNQSEDLVTTMLISNFIMKRLKFTEEELFQFAKTNTAKRTGIIVTPLSNPFRNEMSAKTDIWNFSDDTSDSTILSNRNLMNGAALILCDEVMDKVVEHYKVNVLYILPSSIHEVIIIPDSDSVDVEYLKDMVYEINRSTVACVEEEKANITSIVGTCGFSFIYIFFVLLIIWIYSNHPTEREIEKTKKQRELMKENEQDNIEKMMKSFDKELLKEKGKGNEIQDRDKSL